MANRLLRWFLRGLKGPDSQEVVDEVRALVLRLQQLPQSQWKRRTTKLDGLPVLVDEQWSEKLVGGEQVTYVLEYGDESYRGPEGSLLASVIAPLYRKIKQYDQEELAKIDSEPTRRIEQPPAAK